MKMHTRCNEYYTDGSAQKTMCCFWLKSDSWVNTSQLLVTTTQHRIQTNENHIIQAVLIQYDFYSSNFRQLYRTKMFSQLTNKAHFGMPFYGHEKQTCGLLSKPWLSLFPKIIVFPTSRLCSVQFKYYVIALQTSQVIQTAKTTNITFQIDHISVNTLHSVNMYYS